MTFRDKRRHKIDNYVTGRWVLTIKVDKDGQFKKFKARWGLSGRPEVRPVDGLSHSNQVRFSCGISACRLDVLGFTPSELENCLPSGGNVRLRPPRYPCSVAY